MIKIIQTIAAVVMMLTALGVSAQNEGLTGNQRAIGYTVTDDIDYEGVMVGEAGTYTMGAYLPASTLKDYAGCKVLGVRVAVSQDLGRARVLLNGITADGAGQQLHEQRQRLYQGWNNVFFNGFEYEIDGESDLFYGFDYVETEAMVSNDAGGLCTAGYDTDNSFMLYQDGRYYPVSNAGKLCVQLIVDVSNMPREQAAISFFDYGFKYKVKGEQLEVFAIVANVGLDKASSMEIACRIDDSEPVFVPVDCSLDYGEDMSFEQAYPLDAYAAGGHEVSLYVARINGKDYAEGPRRGKSARFAIYANSLPRKAAFVEVYCDQNNSLTPKLNDGMELMKSDLGGKAIVVNTFRPGNALGVSEAAYLHNFYAYTWPSFTVNRSHFPGEPYVGYDMNDYLSVFPGNMVAGILEELVMQDAATPSFGSVDLEAELSGDRRLSVTARGELLEEAAAIYGDVALTLMLVEDQVRTTQFTGYAESNYTYNDVLRGYLTPAAGKTLTVSDGEFEESFTATLPAGCNPDHMKVVGLLTQAGTPTAERLYDFDITNAASAAVVNNMAGVENVTVDRRADGIYYNLQGIPVANPRNGIYILNGKKVYLK